MGVACVCLCVRAQAELGLFEQSGFGVSHMALGVFHSFGRGSTEFSRLPSTDSGGSRCSVHFGGLRDDKKNCYIYLFTLYKTVHRYFKCSVIFLFLFYFIWFKM